MPSMIWKPSFLFKTSCTCYKPMLKILPSEKFILFIWDLLSTNTKNVWTKDTCLCFWSYDILGIEGLAQDLCICIGKDGVPN